MALVLSNEDIVKLLPMDVAIAALEPSYCDYARGEAISPTRRDMLIPLEEAEKCVYEFKSMPSVYPRKKVACWRMNSDFLTWHKRAGTVRREKEPRAPGHRYVGLVMLFSMETGELMAVFPDGEMQRIRVGAANGIGAKHLSLPDSDTVGLLGSGFQAGAQLQAVCAVRKIKKIRVFSPNQEHRESFAKEMTPKIGIEVEPVGSGAEAVKGAQIAICSTNSAQPVFDKAWIEPGMFLTSIRAFEFDRPTLERCDVLFIHNRGSEPESYVTGGDRGVVPELKTGGAKAKGGVIDWGDQKELAELLAGDATGRTSPEQVTCFVNNIGMSLQFAACGAEVIARAKAQGMGNELPGEWFTEDVHP